MAENNSIKEYYVKIEKMMNNAVNILTAINQSLSTQSPEITIDLINTDNTDNSSTSLRIPSYLYLESRVEQLDNIISNLFVIPKSGEAWFHKSSDMYKLSLVKSTNAPVIPEISNLSNIGFNIKDNNIFKDLVNPKTYIRLNINNLPEYVSQVVVNKIILYNESDADYLKLYNNYADIKNVLFNRIKGTDYDEYESVIDLPIKSDKYKSLFKIEDILEKNIDNDNTYKIRLDTLTYYDKDDLSIQYTLTKGDLICLSNEYAIYEVIDINTQYNSDNNDDTNEYVVILKEYIGHINLQTFEENTEMYFQIYNESYIKYHYVDIPLEENPRIIVFISTLYNNIRSTYSEAIHLNLNEIYMKDSNNNFIYDTAGNKITYIEYYKKYCKNIGDLMDGISKISYPQITNYTNGDLKRLTDSDELKNYVNNTLYIDSELSLKVTRINGHLIDDDVTQNIIKLHNQKNEINSQLKAVQANVDQVYTQLTTTDFSSESNVSQDSLRNQLTEYYNQRIELEKQFINIVDNINQEKQGVLGLSDSKYRVRGITDANDKNDSSIESPIVSYLHNTYGFDCDIIGMDVEYKYKTATKDSTSILSTNNVLFTDWNKLYNIDKERFLKFDIETNKFTIEYSNYNSTSNVVKWNQIDIPINQGEDVVIRIRYKYNIGQPFINLYTPWSDEISIPFPSEYTETTDISSIMDINDVDTLSANFMRTLVNNGYEEHISNKLVDNSQIFYHMPENIYSGFNTPENNLISLKDKLIAMNNEITSYKEAIDSEINAKYNVYLEWDNSSIKLSNSTINNITINELVNGVNDTFVKKNMNLVIQNTGSIPVKLYSIFPGNIDIPLIECENTYFNSYLGDYERVPLLLEGSNIPEDNIMPQYMGQWIYFRQNNPFNNKSIYFDDPQQNQLDNANISSGGLSSFNGSLQQYLGVDNLQVLLAYRNRKNNSKQTNYWGFLSKSNNSYSYVNISNINNTYNYNKVNKFYLYSNVNESNNYILKYEHLTNKVNSSSSYLTNNISISEFISSLPNPSLESYSGAFLIPELLSKNQIVCDTNNREQYITLDVGKSVSIPIIFEYFLVPSNNSTKVSISKTLAFDIKPSLMREPEHYILTVTAKYDYSQTLASSQSYSTLVDGISSI
jgi:hypothetical protein